MELKKKNNKNHDAFILKINIHTIIECEYGCALNVILLLFKKKLFQNDHQHFKLHSLSEEEIIEISLSFTVFTQLYLENNTKRKTIGLYHECDHSKNLPSWNVTAKTKRAATRTRNPLLAILIYFVFKYISLGLELRRRIQIGTLLTFRRIEIYAFNSIISGVVVFCVVR